MRTIVAILALTLAGTAGARAQEGGERAPGIGAQMARLVIQGLPGLAAAGAPAQGAAARGDAVVMPAFRVTDDYRALDEAVDAWSRKLSAEKFTLREGGTYKKFEGARFTAGLEIRYDPVMHGIDFLRISW